MNINNPIPQEWTRYVTQSPVGLEVIPAHLYSTKNFIGNGGTGPATTILTFFDFVQGSRQDLTNMQQPNMLPNPESFLIQNIRIFTWQEPQSDNSGVGNAANLVSQFTDIIQITQRGVANLKIGNKQYGPWMSWTLPANSFVKGGFSTGSDLLADYGQLDGNLYPLNPNLMIAPLQQFTFTLSWPGGPITLSQDIPDGASEQIPIVVLFDGQLARAVQ
jgi:hypothetical protein